MYSVAPLVVRKALQDVRIGQYTIPRGTAMILHLFAMHNTSANYERHADFLPVRPMKPRHHYFMRQHASTLSQKRSSSSRPGMLVVLNLRKYFSHSTFLLN